MTRFAEHTLLSNDSLECHLPGTFPALSICVMHRGETVWQEAWGWIDPESHNTPVTSDSLFDLASVTKLIVETSFLALVEAGAIGLESRLVDVVPEFGRLSPRENRERTGSAYARPSSGGRAFPRNVG